MIPVLILIRPLIRLLIPLPIRTLTCLRTRPMMIPRRLAIMGIGVVRCSMVSQLRGSAWLR